VKPTRIVVGKGKTAQAEGKDEWNRQYFEVEVLIEDPGELDLAKGFALRLIDGWLSGNVKVSEALPRTEQKAEPQKGPPDTATATPELKPEDLDKLPWRLFQEGRRAGWIFADTPGAEKLSDAIVDAHGKLRIGEFQYVLTTGKTGREFISRNPWEKDPK
jgi:hypothetical protein